WDCTLEPSADSHGHLALRLGFRQVKGLAEDAAQAVVAARGNGYADMTQLWRRSGLGVPILERLARADAFGTLGLERREALWAVAGLGSGLQAAGLRKNGRLGNPAATRPLPLFAAMGEEERGTEPEVGLPAMPEGEAVIEDYSTIRLSLRTHPLKLLRHALPGVCTSAQIRDGKDGRRYTVAGLVLVRQRPGSAKGVIFMTLEDETGVTNCVVWPDNFERFRRNILAGRLVAITGKLQRAGSIIHIVTEHVEDRSDLLDSLAADEHIAFPAVPYGRGDEVTHANPDPRLRAEDAPAPRCHPPETLSDDVSPLLLPQRRRPDPIPGSRHPRDQARALFPSRDFR
ncbi:MAG: OB-fold nucleic acid binding domain-containing protein, partial [Alphaproteobacteria bacterium]|nr:OB-fold nucleic acid binding domain-containing protein [Alphaproteobacteria bacterium]